MNMLAAVVLFVGSMAVAQPPTDPPKPVPTIDELVESVRLKTDALDRFSPADRKRIEDAAPHFREEVKTGLLWDRSQFDRLRELRDAMKASGGASEEARAFELASDFQTVVSNLVLADAQEPDGHRQVLLTEDEIKAHTGARKIHAKPVFSRVKVIQVLSPSSALVNVVQGTADQDANVLLKGIKTDVDGETWVGVFARKDDEPFVYNNALGARTTIHAYTAIAKPEDTIEPYGVVVPANSLAQAILDGKAKLMEWTFTSAKVVSKTNVGGKKGKPIQQYTWHGKDVTPVPAPKP